MTKTSRAGTGGAPPPPKPTKPKGKTAKEMADAVNKRLDGDE